MSNQEMLDARDAQAWTAERRFAPISAGAVAYVERGTGMSALFLHGFPLAGFQWRGVIARLAGRRRCIAPDVLGLGYTEVLPAQGVGFGDQVLMLCELLDRLGTGPVDIVANDSNTGVAQLLAARHPERVRSLLLTNGDTELDSPPAPLLPTIELGRAGQLADAVIVPNLRDPTVAASPRAKCRPAWVGVGAAFGRRCRQMSDTSSGCSRG